MELLQIPIGIEDYKSLKSKCYYVDKTSLIKRVADAPKSSVFLFTRPRRFGKSLALSMVETFFALGEDNREFFDGTYIEEAGERYLSLMNSFPVLHLSFKRMDASSYGEFLKLLSFDMSLLYDKAICKYGLKRDNRVWMDSILNESADETLLKTSLDRLLRCVSQDCGRGCIGLVDEYDCPMDRAYREGYYEALQEFMKVFLGDVLKGNPSLEKAIVTGVSQIAHASIFSGLNNLRVNSVFMGSGDEHFGFLQSETEELLAYYGYRGEVGLVESNYGGYVIQGKLCFNPWSVLSFVDNGCAFDSYWTHTGSYDLLKDAVRLLANDSYNDLLRLCSGSSLVVGLKKNIVLGEA